jgi:hypothetical protein
MSFNMQTGFKTERLTADGAINGGNPIRKLVAVGVKGGAAAGTTEWHEGTDAATAAEKRGGVTAPTGEWAWVVGLDQQLSKAYFNLDANSAEVVVVYQPHG